MTAGKHDIQSPLSLADATKTDKSLNEGTIQREAEMLSNAGEFSNGSQLDQKQPFKNCVR